MDDHGLHECGTTRAEGLETGLVRMVENGIPFVVTGGLVRGSVRAAGCLIEPEIGDTVLLYTGTDGTTYILSVLVRAGVGPAVLPLPDGASLRAGEAGIRIESPDVRIEAGKRLSVSAPAGDAVFGTLNVRGAALDTVWNSVRFAARTVDSAAVRIVQTCRRLYRTVEEFEESRIGRLRCLVSGLLFFRSKDASVTAERTVKVNGERIHLG